MRQVTHALHRYRQSWAVTLVRNYLDDDADGLASIIAFAAMFSMMPILVVTFLLLTLVLQINVIRDSLSGVLADEIPPAIAAPVEAIVQSGSGNLASLGIVTVVAFFLGGTKLYSAIDRACARIFQTDRQRYAKRRLFALLMMPMIPTLLLIATSLSVIATAALALPIEEVVEVQPSTLESVLGYLLSYLVSFGLMLMAYWRIPERGPGLRCSVEGAAVGALLIVVLAQSFPLYVQLTGGYNLYGSMFAFVLLLLLWLYLVGQIFVIGAEVAAFRSGCRDDVSLSASQRSGPR
ncbi:MAG TPA: YihY/virulence factor BrkB family protein [Thermomicrobiales bacterium]|nr:YihY/virulence factor BrkB family protein [Thermomicrobiales bacterium]